MRRDMDLVREILLAAEELPAEGGNIDLPEHSEEQVRYHLRIIREANLLDVQSVAYADTEHEVLWIRGLTWSGHEFLDTARDNRKWKAATAKAAHVVGGIAFEIVRELLMAQAKAMVGLGTDA